MEEVAKSMSELELEEESEDQMLAELTIIENKLEEKKKKIEERKKKLEELEDLELQEKCLQLKIKKKITELEVSNERKITII